MSKHQSENKSLQKAKAFNLVELIVVVGIISILAAVAIPSYRTYNAKAKVVEAIVVLRSLEKAAMSEWEATGSAPTSFIFAGGTTIEPGYISYKTSVVDEVGYGKSSADNFYVCVLTKDIIPGAIANTKKRICARTWFASSKENICGNWDGDIDGGTLDVPLEYLPSNCQCKGVGSNSCD